MEKDCPSFPGYSITNDGRVFTHRKRFGKGKGHGGGVNILLEYSRELNQFIGHGGYRYVSVSTKRGQRSVAIHTLIMDAFVGPRPYGFEVRHINSNPLDDSLTNLAYGTAKENSQDKILTGRYLLGSRHPRAKLTETTVLEIRRLYQNGNTIAGLARTYGVGESTIRDAVKGRHWKYV